MRKPSNMPLAGNPSRRIALALVFAQALLLSASGLAQTPLVLQRETNPNYREGDWVSYSMARYVTSVAIGRQYIYFGTRDSGITRYHRYRESWDFPWTTSNGLADNGVSVVAYDLDTDYLWCATRYAVSYFQPAARKWRNALKEEFGLPANDDIESIGIDKDKVYFLSRAGRAYESRKFGGVVLNAEGFDRGNRKIRWFGRRSQNRREFPNFFMSDGYLFNPTGIVEDNHFRQAKVVSAVDDDWGNTWIATWGLGAGKADTRSLMLQMLDFGLATISADALALADNVLWVGSASASNVGKGITAWNMNSGRWDTFEQKYVTDLRSDRVNQISAEGETLWFSTAYGAAQYRSDKGRWHTFDRFDGLADNIVFDTAADDSSIWVATDAGISRIVRSSLTRKDSVQIEAISPGNLSLVQVRDLELTNNLLWAATNNGVYVYDTAKRTGGFSDEIEGPLSTSITSISHFENEIWFGSASGIDVFDMKKKEWLGVPEGRAFPNTRINKVVAGKDAVWAATDHGVIKYDRESKNWRKFTTEDGLLDDRVTAIVPDGDYIWFGTSSGVTQFRWNAPGRID